MVSGKKVLLIDCNDSFTYNIVELLRKCKTENLEIIPISKLQPDIVKKACRIILSPGPGVPNDYPVIFKALELTASDIPVLGICLGHQIICSYFGARISNLKHVIHGQQRQIYIINQNPLFNGFPESFNAGLYHSWVVKKPLPADIELSAISSDRMIMAVRHRTRPVYGIQFHPESFITELGAELLSNFLLTSNTPIENNQVF